MSAPAVRLVPSTLDELKVERTAIRGRLASIKESRDRLGEADVAADSARAELGAFDGRHESKVDEWVHRGCKGPRPEPAFSERAALEGKLNRAIHATDTNRTALDTLTAREADERHALAAIDRPIKVAAVAILGGKLDAIADETIALREKLTANETSLMAAHGFFRDIGRETDTRGVTSVDSNFHPAAMRIRGIDLPAREAACPVDAAASKYWQSMLDDLTSRG